MRRKEPGPFNTRNKKEPVSFLNIFGTQRKEKKTRKTQTKIRGPFGLRTFAWEGGGAQKGKKENNGKRKIKIKENNDKKREKERKRERREGKEEEEKGKKGSDEK